MNKFIVGILIFAMGFLVLFIRFGTKYSLKDKKQPREKVDYYTMPILGVFGILYGIYLVITFFVK